MGLPSALVARAALSPLVGPEPGAWKPAASPIPPAVGGWGSSGAMGRNVPRARTASKHREGFAVEGQGTAPQQAKLPEASLQGLFDSVPGAAARAGVLAVEQPPGSSGLGKQTGSAATSVPSAMGTRQAAKSRGVDGTASRVSHMAYVPLAALDSSTLSLGKALASLGTGEQSRAGRGSASGNAGAAPTKAKGLRGSGGRVPSPAARRRASRGFSQGARAAAKSLPLARNSIGLRGLAPSLFVSGSRSALPSTEDEEEKGAEAAHLPPTGWPQRAAKPGSAWSRGERAGSRGSVAVGPSLAGSASLASASLTGPSFASMGLEAGSDAIVHGAGADAVGSQPLRISVNAEEGPDLDAAGGQRRPNVEQGWAPVPKPGLAALGMSPVGHRGVGTAASPIPGGMERGLSRSRLPIATPNAWGSESPALDGLVPDDRALHLEP